MPQGLSECADTVNFAKFLAALRALKFRYKFREILVCPKPQSSLRLSLAGTASTVSGPRAPSESHSGTRPMRYLDNR